jgi:hypothetical protein
MKRFRSHFIGRVRVVFAVTIFIGLVAVMNISLTTQKISSQTGSLSLSQNTPPAADNKTIQTNLNTPVEINLTAKPPPTVNDIPMTVNGSSNYNNNLVDPFGIREIYPTAAGGEQLPHNLLPFWQLWVY